MSKVQYYYKERKKSETGATGTVTYDLPESGVIPEIHLRAFSTPTASTNPALPLEAAITKIEITDGAKVIKSLTGNQAKALSCFHKYKNYDMTDTDDNGVEQCTEFSLILGGEFNGKLWAPDFAKFANPQIKISWDYSLTSDKGASCDADTSPAMKFTILCKIVRESSKYAPGYLKSTQIKTWTQAASTETPTDLPRGELMAGIMIEAGYVDLDWTEDIEKIELDFNNGEWKPIEMYEEEIVPFQKELFPGGFSISYMKDLIDAKNFDTRMGYVTSFNGTGIGATNVTLGFESTHMGINQCSVFDTATPTAISTYEQVYVHAKGQLPFNCAYIPMSALLNGEGSTIDTAKYRQIALKLTSGSSASTSSKPAIVCEYLVPQ